MCLGLLDQGFCKLLELDYGERDVLVEQAGWPLHAVDPVAVVFVCTRSAYARMLRISATGLWVPRNMKRWTI